MAKANPQLPTYLQSYHTGQEKNPSKGIEDKLDRLAKEIRTAFKNVSFASGGGGGGDANFGQIFTSRPSKQVQDELEQARLKIIKDINSQKINIDKLKISVYDFLGLRQNIRSVRGETLQVLEAKRREIIESIDAVKIAKDVKVVDFKVQMSDFFGSKGLFASLEDTKRKDFADIAFKKVVEIVKNIPITGLSIDIKSFDFNHLFEEISKVPFPRDKDTKKLVNDKRKEFINRIKFTKDIQIDADKATKAISEILNPSIHVDSDLSKLWNSKVYELISQIKFPPLKPENVKFDISELLYGVSPPETFAVQWQFNKKRVEFLKQIKFPSDINVEGELTPESILNGFQKPSQESFAVQWKWQQVKLKFLKTIEKEMKDAKFYFSTDVIDPWIILGSPPDVSKFGGGIWKNIRKTILGQLQTQIEKDGFEFKLADTSFDIVRILGSLPDSKPMEIQKPLGSIRKLVLGKIKDEVEKASTTLKFDPIPINELLGFIPSKPSRAFTKELGILRTSIIQKAQETIKTRKRGLFKFDTINLTDILGSFESSIAQKKKEEVIEQISNKIVDEAQKSSFSIFETGNYFFSKEFIEDKRVEVNKKILDIIEEKLKILEGTEYLFSSDFIKEKRREIDDKISGTKIRQSSKQMKIEEVSMVSPNAPLTPSFAETFLNPPVPSSGIGATSELKVREQREQQEKRNSIEINQNTILSNILKEIQSLHKSFGGIGGIIGSSGKDDEKKSNWVSTILKSVGGGLLKGYAGYQLSKVGTLSKMAISGLSKIPGTGAIFGKGGVARNMLAYGTKTARKAGSILKTVSTGGTKIGSTIFKGAAKAAKALVPVADIVGLGIGAYKGATASQKDIANEAERIKKAYSTSLGGLWETTKTFFNPIQQGKNIIMAAREGTGVISQNVDNLKKEQETQTKSLGLKDKMRNQLVQLGATTEDLDLFSKTSNKVEEYDPVYKELKKKLIKKRDLVNIKPKIETEVTLKGKEEEKRLEDIKVIKKQDKIEKEVTSDYNKQVLKQQETSTVIKQMSDGMKNSLDAIKTTSTITSKQIVDSINKLGDSVNAGLKANRPKMSIHIPKQTYPNVGMQLGYS